MRGEFPEFREWSVAAVALLKGVVYADDVRVWGIVNANVSALETFFARLGLRMMVEEGEGMVYLRQLTEAESPDGYADLPRLFRSSRLSYSQTLTCVLLRDALRRFEEEDLRNERCVVEEATLFEDWRGYFPASQDEVRSRRDLAGCLSALEDIGFIRRFGDEPPAWEVRRIIKARLPIADLEQLRDSLAAAREKLVGEGGRAG